VREKKRRALLKVKTRDPGFEWPDEGEDVLGGLFMDPNNALGWSQPAPYSKLLFSNAIRQSFEVSASTAFLAKRGLGLPLAPFEHIDELDLDIGPDGLSFEGTFPLACPHRYIDRVLEDIERGNEIRPVESGGEEALLRVREFNLDLE
jgi:hypothetical protein